MWSRVIGVVMGAALLWPALPPVSHITETSQRPVEIATMPCDRDLQATSTGFLLEDQLVITVAHAIYESRDFAVRDATGEWHEATVLYMDLERDLALLEVPALTASRVVTQPGARDDQVTMLGGAASGTVDGVIMRRVRLTTQVIGDLTETSARSGYELSVEITGGDSGAAIVDDQDRLVGLVFARSTRRDASWATSVTEIDAILDRRGVPAWECERESDTRLDLRPREPEPERLAP